MGHSDCHRMKRSIPRLSPFPIDKHRQQRRPDCRNDQQRSEAVAHRLFPPEPKICADGLPNWFGAALVAD